MVLKGKGKLSAPQAAVQRHSDQWDLMEGAGSWLESSEQVRKREEPVRVVNHHWLVFTMGATTGLKWCKHTGNSTVNLVQHWSSPRKDGRNTQKILYLYTRTTGHSVVTPSTGGFCPPSNFLLLVADVLTLGWFFTTSVWLVLFFCGVFVCLGVAFGPVPRSPVCSPVSLLVPFPCQLS